MQPAASAASQDQCMCDETVAGCYSDQGWGARVVVQWVGYIDTHKMAGNSGGQ